VAGIQEDNPHKYSWTRSTPFNPLLALVFFNFCPHKTLSSHVNHVAIVTLAVLFVLDSL